MQINSVYRLAWGCCWVLTAAANDLQWEAGRRAIEARSGCFLVDYSFVETEAVRAGYTKDNRVYDVNKNKSVKEWIYAEQVTPKRYKLQHVLMANDLTGKVMEGSILRHTGEDWEYQAPFWYDYAGNFSWKVKQLGEGNGQWLRRITSLDDGLRYQCAAAWKLDGGYPEWSCSNYAPIPGRETRDMKRNDYQALERQTRLIVYGQNWLEREANTKVVQKDEAREPLAKEVGKIWYVRLPDTECRAAREFAEARQTFWRLTREAWDAVLDGSADVVEKGEAGSFARYAETMKLEKEYLGKNLAEPAVQAEARERLVKIFRGSRKN